jgi:hypothetical protein
MIKKHEKRGKAIVYKKGAWVTIKVDQIDQNKTNNKRVFGLIISLS